MPYLKGMLAAWTLAPDDAKNSGRFSPRLCVSGEDLLAHLASADDFVFCGGQLRDGEGAAGVEFLGADAHFGAEAEFAAIGETGRGVPVDGGRIHLAQELARAGFIGSDDGIGVLGGVAVDVRDSVFDAR